MCFKTHCKLSKIDLAILILRKGIINLSSKIFCIILLFLVKAVGLMRALMIKSYKSLPSNRVIRTFIEFISRPVGVCNKGDVKIQPLIRILGRFKSSFTTVIAPKLCAYRNSGNYGWACPNNLMTSFTSLSTVPQPRGPPEYPKPVKSTNKTSKSLRAKKLAISLNLPECYPNPWMTAMVRLGFGGVYLVWYNLTCGCSESMYCLVMVYF